MKTTIWYRDAAFWAVLVAGVLVLALVGMVTGAGAAPGLTALLLLVFVYPVLEEWVFRGVLQPLLHEWLHGRRCGVLTWANGLTSLVFALAHVPVHGVGQGVLVFGPSLVFGVYRERHDSVLSPILLHGAWNAAALLLLGQSVQLF